MIKVIDKPALKLIAPSVKRWASIYDILSHLQSIHYIDCNYLDGWDWFNLLKDDPQLEDKCTEYGGWAKLSESDWRRLLRYQPQFERYKK